VASVHKRTVPADRLPFVGELVLTFVDRGCRVVRAADPYCRILGFSRPEPLFSFQVAPQLHSRGRVDPVPDPLLLRKSHETSRVPKSCAKVKITRDYTSASTYILMEWCLIKYREYYLYILTWGSQPMLF
jgi:hypothetical protein